MPDIHVGFGPDDPVQPYSLTPLRIAFRIIEILFPVLTLSQSAFLAQFAVRWLVWGRIAGERPERLFPNAEITALVKETPDGHSEPGDARSV